MASLLLIKMFSISLILRQLLTTLYYKYCSLALLILTFGHNGLLDTISYFYTFILYILLI